MSGADLLRLGLLSGIWGSNFLLVEVALRGMGPDQIVLLRLVASGVFLLALTVAARLALPREAVVWWKLLGMGVLGQALPWFLFAWGQERVTSSVAGIYNASTPLIALPIAWFFHQSTSNRRELTSLAVGFAGVLVVLAPWSETGGTRLLGQLACLGGAACYAVGYAYAHHLIVSLRYHKLALSATQALAAAVVFAAVSNVHVAERVTFTVPVALAAAALAVGTSVAFVVNYQLIRNVGPVRASITMYLLPVVAVVLGVAVLHERLPATQVVGAVVILLAVWSMREPAPTRPAPQPGLAGVSGRAVE